MPGWRRERGLEPSIEEQRNQLRDRMLGFDLPGTTPPATPDTGADIPPSAVGERTPWPFEVTDKHPHPSQLGETDMYKEAAVLGLPGTTAEDRYSMGTTIERKRRLEEAAAAQQPPEPAPAPAPTGTGAADIGYTPTAPMPERPTMPTTAPITPPTADQMGLPEVPDYYSGLDPHIPDPYVGLMPGSTEADRLNAAAERVSDAVLGRTTLSDADRQEFGITGTPTVQDLVRIKQQAQEAPQDPLVRDDHWQDVERGLAEASPYDFSHLDPSLPDPYADLDYTLTDYYTDVPMPEDRFSHIDPTLTDYYRDLDFDIPDFYRDFDPTVDDRYSHLLDEEVRDRYEELGFDVPDYYEDITPLGYEHYLGLDPTQPDYYSKLENLIEEVGFQYDPLTEEQKLKLAEQYADIHVSPKISAINRAMEQAKLDAEAQEARIRAANSGTEEALARREEAQARKDLESAIARGGGRAGAVEWLSAERQGYHLEKLATAEAQQAAELTAIANQLGLTKRQMQERIIELEGMRGQLTNQELQRLREQEWERQAKGANWMFEASLAVADRLAETGRWEHEQATHIADRLTQIDQFNAQQDMDIADRKTALDQWMKEMEMSKADRQTALDQWEQERQLQIADRLTSVDQWMKEMDLSVRDRKAAIEQWTKEMELSKADRRVALEQWEKQFELEVQRELAQMDRFNAELGMSIADRRVAMEQWMKEMEFSEAERRDAMNQFEKTHELELAYQQAQEDARFREWEADMRMAIGDRQYQAAIDEFNMRMDLKDRTYQQAVDEFTRELQVADRLTQRDIDQMQRALDVYDRTQLNTAQQYELWVTLAEVTGVFPDRLPGT